jgi:hypothetical protein
MLAFIMNDSGRLQYKYKAMIYNNITLNHMSLISHGTPLQRTVFFHIA